MITVPPQSGDGQVLPNAITISVDTEYIGPHTLTIQTAARLDADTLVVQVYRSAAVPDLPTGWDQSRYLPITDEKYGRFCKRIIVRPLQLISADLSPARMVRDLYDLGDLHIVSRAEGRLFIDLLHLPEYPHPILQPPNLSWDKRRKRWKIPQLLVTLVGHFLR